MDKMVIIRHAKKISSHNGKTKHGLSIYVTSDTVYDEIYNWLTVTCNNLFVTTRNIEYTHTKSFL